MEIGLVTPVLTLLPRAHATWERGADVDDVIAIAAAADRFGYDHVTCSEHVAIPEAVAAVRGGRYWDPLATFGLLAAHTERVRFATFVLVLGYHHPLEIVKRYGTLDRVSRGRVVLGVGVGSLEEEFALLDAPFADRGARADDTIRALRATWGRPHAEYHGAHHDFEGWVVDPTATSTTVPIWVGGRTARSLRRAVELADGWAPFGIDTTTVGEWLAAARATDAWERRTAALAVWIQPAPLDPLADPGGTARTLEALADAGATGVVARFVHHSRDHLLEQMAALVPIAHAIDAPGAIT